MKKVFLLPLVAALFLSACASDKTTDAPPSSNDQGATAGPLPEPANAAPATPSPAPTPATTTTSTTTTSTSTTTTPTAPTTTTSSTPSTDYPKGIPVPGKKGMVLSPYAQYAGLVDVSGFPSGSIVSCPFTHKKFIVP